MALVKPAPLVLPFCSMIYSHNQILKDAKKFIEKSFSQIVFSYGPVNFSGFTRYYEKEMGENLKKIYFFFEKIMNAENFHEYKILTNGFENRISPNNERYVNLDPGYITQAKFVLFTTKNRSHRIYIAKGIYAEVQLEYKKNSFTGLYYSHADYIQKDFINFANKAREYFRERIKKE